MTRSTARRAGVLALLGAATTLLAATPAALATFPGHNGLIAFHSATPEGTRIFTVRANGNELRQITHVAGDAMAVDWSPDGRRIAFEIDTPDTATVAIMNADGSGLVTLPGIGLANFDPSFTPDGKRLVYNFFDGEHGGIASMKVDGTDQRLVRTDDFIGDPNVSPDGATMSVTCQQDPDVLQALCTLPVGGGALTQLTPFTAEVGAKSDWAPDGSQLVVHRPRRPAEPGRLGQRGRGAARRDRRAPAHALLRRRDERVRRLLLARRPMDRLPPRGPGAVRAVPDAARRDAPASDPAAVRLRPALHRLGTATGPRGP
jgi:dipeptidyl aminopeptidase/acylaminoacyl peptidase